MCIGSVIDTSYVKFYFYGVRKAQFVADGISKGVGSVKVGMGGIGKCPIAIIRNAAMGSLGKAVNSDGVAIYVGIIGS